MAAILGKRIFRAVAVSVVVLERQAGTRFANYPGARRIISDVKRNVQLRLVASPDVHNQRLVRKTVTGIVIDGYRSKKGFAAERADGIEECVLRRD